MGRLAGWKGVEVGSLLCVGSEDCSHNCEAKWATCLRKVKHVNTHTHTHRVSKGIVLSDISRYIHTGVQILTLGRLTTHGIIS